jgi:sulfur-oxidizing protein SoxY
MMQRRQWLHASAALGCGALGLSAAPPAAWAQGMVSGRLRSLSEMLAPWSQGASAPLRQAVHLQLPLLADNGHLVPLTVRVDSPMTEADHVQEIVLVSQRNPVERMATFHMGPWSGRAEVSTRVRLAGSQMVLALARMSNGRWCYDLADVIATESACVDGS